MCPLQRPAVDGHREERDPDDAGSIRHCLVIALIGLAAIAIGFSLKPDLGDAGPRLATAQPQKVTPPQADDQPAERFEYFPAQFPGPQGEPEAQPATF